MSTSDKRRCELHHTLNRLLVTAQQEHLSDAEWGVIDNRGYPRHFAENDPDALNEALSFVRDARMTREDRSTRPRARHGPEYIDLAQRNETSQRSCHDKVLSDVFAVHALQVDEQQRFGIAAFRRKVLKGRLVPRADAGQWVREQAKRERRPTVMRTTTSTGKMLHVESLAYALDDDEYAHHVPVRVGGDLDQLRLVSQKLVEYYGWMPAQASFFVLTGATPWTASLRGRVQTQTSLRARERITLTIHPMCTPQEVARFYAQTRRNHYGRLRRLSPKHCALAAFYAEQPEEVTASQLLRAWNATCEKHKFTADWKYNTGDADLLHRDAKTALFRLVDFGNTQRGILPAGIRVIKVRRQARSSWQSRGSKSRKS